MGWLVEYIQGQSGRQAGTYAGTCSERKRWPLLGAVGTPRDNYGMLFRAMRQDQRIDGPECAGRWRGNQSRLLKQSR